MEQRDVTRGGSGLRTDEEVENRSGKGKERESRYIFNRRGCSIEGLEGNEVRLSEGEMKAIKKLITEKGRESRKSNIVIKGGGSLKEGENGKEWVENFIKEKLVVDCKIMECRSSRPVIITKVENEKKKRKVMRNKNRLKGGNIFIENYLGRKENTRGNE